MLKHSDSPWIVHIHAHPKDPTKHVYELCVTLNNVEEVENNGRLIKAAPELYMACHEALRYLVDTADAPTKADLLARLIQAIELVEKKDAGH